ncbi:uncharacterized protein B0J16DRAFT_372740 [Fusarium flagelliforme]|uniref:uncharacterized protein n=1 Tax=Fusarium flagelliforme TaxID=2675880 RepID=UPI001E8E63B7|nr:uncharacterized protein B0J16DRAFT_372740 [Fusarium flagelliforme]KAH7186010.1 hypothetical protein B0J16DRAFT_372740 [Fusarium flagelliforme]
MSSTIKLTVAAALAHVPFIPHVGFIGQKAGERPCYHCVVSLHQDARGLCVAEEGSMSRCLVCADAHETCCAIPDELLGAAQRIWNCYLAHALHDNKWTGLQRWRIDKLFGDCTSAFRSTYHILLNPNRPMTYDREDIDLVNRSRDPAKQRESMNMLVRAVYHEEPYYSSADIGPEVAALFPAFFADCAKIDSLRNQLQLIGTCRDTPVSGEEPTTNRDEFRMMLNDDLVELIEDALNTGVSAPQVTDRTPT